MAKNRKNKSVAIRFGPALKALLLCSLFVASGVGYVWQKSLIADLEVQLKAQERLLVEHQYKNKKLTNQLAWLRSPGQLRQRIRDLNLGLELPSPANVVWLLEPVEVPSAPAPPTGRQFAARP